MQMIFWTRTSAQTKKRRREAEKIMCGCVSQTDICVKVIGIYLSFALLPTSARSTRMSTVKYAAQHATPIRNVSRHSPSRQRCRYLHMNAVVLLCIVCYLVDPNHPNSGFAFGIRKGLGKEICIQSGLSDNAEQTCPSIILKEAVHS